VVGSAQGCTSTATGSIALKPVPVPTLTTNGPLCNGGLFSLNSSTAAAYQWSGPQSFTASIQNPTINPIGLAGAGVYNLTVTAVNGCTASTNHTLTVYPTPTLAASGSTVCTGQVFSFSGYAAAGSGYAWTGPQGFVSSQQNNVLINGTTNQSGTYNLTVTSVNGCTNTTSTFVSIVPPPSPYISLTSGTLCAESLGGSPNSIGLTAGGANSYTITAPNYMSNSNVSGPFTTLSPLPPYQVTGPVTVLLSGSNGVCTSNTSTSFTIVPNPVIAISASVPVICSGQSFTYSSSGASTYTWMAISPVYTLIANGATAVVSPSLSSIYAVTGSSQGCSSATQNSTLTVNPLPQFSISPNPAVICIGDAIQLGITGTGTSYTWSPPFFIDNSTGAVVNVYPPSQQNYVVQGSLNGCISSGAITVSVMPVPTAQIIAPKTVFCANDSLVMFGSGGIRYEWTGPMGLRYYSKDLGFRPGSAGFSGTYTLTVSDANNCRNSTTQVITVNSLPQGYLSSANMKGCAPLCADMAFKAVPGTNSLTLMAWQVNNLNFYGQAFRYCFDSPGNYRITGDLTDVNACANTVTAVVTVYPRPQADFDYAPKDPIEKLDEIQFNDISKGNPVEFHWEFGSLAYSSERKDPKVSYPDMGIYPVALVIKNQWLCADTVVKNITVHPDFAVFVPNSFTPNDDNLNEKFGPVMRGAKSFNFSIYNRWGEKLFETSDLDKGWDGTFKGKACKEDVYVWKLYVQSQNEFYSDPGKQEKKLEGTVVLYR
jgi:gliding motility-associated-like protein